VTGETKVRGTKQNWRKLENWLEGTNKTRIIVEIFVLSPKNVTIEFYRIAKHSAKPRKTKSMGGAIV